MVFNVSTHHSSFLDSVMRLRLRFQRDELNFFVCVFSLYTINMIQTRELFITRYSVVL